MVQVIFLFEFSRWAGRRENVAKTPYMAKKIDPKVQNTV
jgi:hypothetical protein